MITMAQPIRTGPTITSHNRPTNTCLDHWSRAVCIRMWVPGHAPHTGRRQLRRPIPFRIPRIPHVPKPPFCVGRLGGSKNDADVVSHSPVQQCRWPSGGPAVPTASVLVGWKCSIVHFVAYNFSTLHLCRRCLLSERHVA